MKPTATDAELILKLYDLRREERMRKARDYYAFKFFPGSYEELTKIMSARGSDENAYIRQVTSYWDMAAAFVVQGALNAELFYETCGEMWLVYTKMKPFLPQLRKEYAPTYFQNVEKVAEGTEAGRARVEMMVKRLEAMKAAAAK